MFDARPNLDSLFVNPTLGTSTDEFTRMLQENLSHRFGDRDYSALTKDLLDFADANRDGTVTFRLLLFASCKVS